MVNDTKQRLFQLIDGLEAVRARPNVYLSERVGPIGNFLNGFELAYSLLGIPIDIKAAADVLEERGFNTEGFDVIIQMHNKGLSEDEITNKVLEITIETLRRIADKH